MHLSASALSGDFLMLSREFSFSKCICPQKYTPSMSTIISTEAKLFLNFMISDYLAFKSTASDISSTLATELWLITFLSVEKPRASMTTTATKYRITTETLFLSMFVFMFVLISVC